MPRAAITASLILATAFSIRAQQPKPSQQPALPTFRATVELVQFGVTVVDKQGKPVTGLKAEDFQIVENGKPQTLKFFTAGAPEQAPPLHLGLLLDTSGSMASDIKDSRSAAVKFVNTLDAAADVTLVDFDAEVRVARFGPRDYARLVERIRGRNPDGMTALYDAIGVYLNGAQSQDGSSNASPPSPAAGRTSPASRRTSTGCSRRSRRSSPRGIRLDTFPPTPAPMAPGGASTSSSCEPT